MIQKLSDNTIEGRSSLDNPIDIQIDPSRWIDVKTWVVVAGHILDFLQFKELGE